MAEGNLNQSNRLYTSTCICTAEYPETRAEQLPQEFLDLLADPYPTIEKTVSTYQALLLGGLPPTPDVLASNLLKVAGKVGDIYAQATFVTSTLNLIGTSPYFQIESYELIKELVDGAVNIGRDVLLSLVNIGLVAAAFRAPLDSPYEADAFLTILLASFCSTLSFVDQIITQAFATLGSSVTRSYLLTKVIESGSCPLCILFEEMFKSPDVSIQDFTQAIAPLPQNDKLSFLSCLNTLFPYTLTETDVTPLLASLRDNDPNIVEDLKQNPVFDSYPALQSIWDQIVRSESISPCLCDLFAILCKQGQFEIAANLYKNASAVERVCFCDPTQVSIDCIAGVLVSATPNIPETDAYGNYQPALPACNCDNHMIDVLSAAITLAESKTNRDALVTRWIQDTIAMNCCGVLPHVMTSLIFAKISNDAIVFILNNITCYAFNQFVCDWFTHMTQQVRIGQKGAATVLARLLASRTYNPIATTIVHALCSECATDFSDLIAEAFSKMRTIFGQTDLPRLEP